jgi:hypothetical protein
MTTQADQDWRPRLSIDITPEQAAALSKYIPWGFRKMLFNALIDLLIAAFERGGAEVLMSVIQRELDLPALFIKQKQEE